MVLTADSLKWAIQSVVAHSDGDLFPRVQEFAAIQAAQDQFIELILKSPLSSFQPGASRRFIVPKDELSYRRATQLDPQDSILLTSIVYQYGAGIEERRKPADMVFSYRFGPTAQRGLYSSQSGWNEFWTKANMLGKKYGCILYCDISDFYNQIYHHTLENQLRESGFTNQAIQWCKGLFNSTTANVSRGVPIGPHAVHLIAEATLIPVDNSLEARGIPFLRYADDIMLFSVDRNEARKNLHRLAEILDQQQRLTVQKSKTRLFDWSDFSAYCASMIEDRPISTNEARLLKVVAKYSRGEPYRTISFNQIKESDWKQFSPEILTKIIRDYLDKTDPDFIRLRWFYRRLAQIGHPGAIRVTIDEIDRLAPCFASICYYLASVQLITQDDWMHLGSELLRVIDRDEVKENPYFKLSILSLFTKNRFINHFERLASLFDTSDNFAKREILLAAKMNSQVDWIREHKETFSQMDPWSQMAFMYCCKDLPDDERRFFLNAQNLQRPSLLTIASWAKQR